MVRETSKEVGWQRGMVWLARRVGWLVLFVSAAAQGRDASLVDAGVAEVEAAQFERALGSFEQVWNQAEGLSSQDLVRLLATRAVAHYALRAEDAFEQDLRLLAVLDPDYAFGEHLPPEVDARFRALSRQAPPPVLAVSTRRHHGQVRWQVQVQHLPDALARETRVMTRRAGGPWQVHLGRELALSVPSVPGLEWYVEVVGPGGAVVLRDGDAANPRRLHDIMADPGPPSLAAASTSKDHDSRAWRWWLVGGTGALSVAAAVVLAVVMPRAPEPTSRVAAPELR